MHTSEILSHLTLFPRLYLLYPPMPLDWTFIQFHGSNLIPFARLFVLLMACLSLCADEGVSGSRISCRNPTQSWMIEGGLFWAR